MKTPLFLVAALAFGALAAHAQPAKPQAPDADATADATIEERLDAATKRLEEAKRRLEQDPNSRDSDIMAAAVYNRVYRSAPVIMEGAPYDSRYLTPPVSSLLKSRIEISTVPYVEGTEYRIEFENVTVSAVLQAIAGKMGVRAVIDPELDKSYYQKGGFEAKTLDELLQKIGGKTVDKLKSPAGVYFFGFNARAMAIVSATPLFRRPRANEPNVYPGSEIDPGFNALPDWSKTR